VDEILLSELLTAITAVAIVHGSISVFSITRNMWGRQVKQFGIKHGTQTFYLKAVLWIRIGDPQSGTQCLGSGLWIRDPGWKKNPDPGTGINIQDHFPRA
jgi:hypothetical protein